MTTSGAARRWGIRDPTLARMLADDGEVSAYAAWVVALELRLADLVRFVGGTQVKGEVDNSAD